MCATSTAIHTATTAWRTKPTAKLAESFAWYAGGTVMHAQASANYAETTATYAETTATCTQSTSTRAEMTSMRARTTGTIARATRTTARAIPLDARLIRPVARPASLSGTCNSYQCALEPNQRAPHPTDCNTSFVPAQGRLGSSVGRPHFANGRVIPPLARPQPNRQDLLPPHGRLVPQNARFIRRPRASCTSARPTATNGDGLRTFAYGIRTFAYGIRTVARRIPVEYPAILHQQSGHSYQLTAHRNRRPVEPGATCGPCKSHPAKHFARTVRQHAPALARHKERQPDAQLIQ